MRKPQKTRVNFLASFVLTRGGGIPVIFANSWERRNESSEKADEAGSPGQSSKNYWEKPRGSEEAVDGRFCSWWGWGAAVLLQNLES